MSAYSELKTEFKDGELLLAALTGMGFKPINCIGKPQQLTGYHGDKRQEIADIIIPRSQVGGASNDIGFVKRGGKFHPIISDYDSQTYDSKWLDKVKVGSAEAGILRQAKRGGLRLSSKKVVNGVTEFQFIMA